MRTVGLILTLLLISAGPAAAQRMCRATVPGATGELSAWRTGIIGGDDLRGDWSPRAEAPTELKLILNQWSSDGRFHADRPIFASAKWAVAAGGPLPRLRLELAVDDGGWIPGNGRLPRNGGTADTPAPYELDLPLNLTSPTGVYRLRARIVDEKDQVVASGTFVLDAADREAAMLRAFTLIRDEPDSHCQTSAVQRPQWVRKPSGDEIRRYYPDQAWRKGLSGRVDLSCKVLADGKLSECAVVSESPLGEQFGAAALNLAAFYRMSPKTADGSPVAGASVRIPVTFHRD